MSKVGQSESDDIFVSGKNGKELTMTGSLLLHFLFQWKSKKCGSFHYGFLNFWHTKQNSQ